MATETGTVKWFDPEKGYGFITNEKGNDVFVHHSQIHDDKQEKKLNEGDSVSFVPEDGKKGPMATNVEKMM